MTASSITSLFSAADPTLGYLYQIRLGLLLTLRRLKSEPNFSVSIEVLDDVAFESSNGEPSDLIQTKHHRAGIANLTDASKDLWKTLRIWFEGAGRGQISSHTNLFLVTTGVSPDSSAAFRLRSTAERDVNAAKAALDATARTSTNRDNEAGYAAYLAASDSVRLALLAQVTIVDASPTVIELDNQLRSEVFWAADIDHQSAFLERLEGWWLRRVLQQLAASPRGRIAGAEVEAVMADLRESFKYDSLPIDDDLLRFTLDDAAREAHEGMPFVLQMEIIKAGKRRISAAVRDYYRAFEQRSRWVRDELILDMDLTRYEKRLIEEWEIIFDAKHDELGDAPTEDLIQVSARSVLAWAETAHIAIRPNVTEPFVCRGSLHMLSDEIRIGWHSQFKDRLAALIQQQDTTTEGA